MEAKIYNYRKWVPATNPESISTFFSDCLGQAGFETLNFIEHFFAPQGYTALWLIGESHLAIHTFPEKNKTYIELSSCNKEKNQTFKELVELKFPCRK